MSFLNKLWMFLVLLVAVMIFAIHELRAEEKQKCVNPASGKSYAVINNKVDKDTFTGYVQFQANCSRCHGSGAVGSSFAPALVDSLTVLTKEQFVNTVTNGKKSSTSTSAMVMPAWKDNKDVMSYVDQIYTYLKARSDKMIGQGEAVKLPDGEDSICK